MSNPITDFVGYPPVNDKAMEYFLENKNEIEAEFNVISWDDAMCPVYLCHQTSSIFITKFINLMFESARNDYPIENFGLLGFTLSEKCNVPFPVGCTRMRSLFKEYGLNIGVHDPVRLHNEWKRDFMLQLINNH